MSDGGKSFSKLAPGLLMLAGAGFMIATALGFIAAIAPGRSPAADTVEISIEQLDAARFRISYHLGRRQSLIFNRISGDYRDQHWQIETPGFQLTHKDGAAHLVRRDSKAFTDVAILTAATTERLPKDYQPAAIYGEGGTLIYTGHFWPVERDGDRLQASFNFTAARGSEVVAFGERGASLTDWRSPLKRPAFIYFGPLRQVETDHVIALVDPAAPQWIIDEFDDLTPRVFDYFAGAFGRNPNSRLQRKSTLFLAAPLGDDEGRLSYSGDALPGQFQITLEGAAWDERSRRAENIFRRSTLHEAFHLWQLAAAPGEAEKAEWIHEGGADAVAVDAMIALEFWDGDDWVAFGSGARRDCAAGLQGGSLSGASERRAFTALYACGYLITDAVARADGTSATAFWRDFMRAARDGGYSEALFFDFVAARTGDEEFARALKYFVSTPLADPAREINQLFGPAPASGALAPSGSSGDEL